MTRTPLESRGGTHSRESEKQRWDRNFTELLQELRVLQAGVQILFAFLLTLPFSARFESVDRFDKGVYLVALLGVTVAAGMIMAPVAYHRMLFRRGLKPQLVRSAHRMASGGLAALGVGMVAGVLLVTDVVIGRNWAYVLAAGAAVVFTTLWLVLPFGRREEGDEPSWSGEQNSPGEFTD